MNQTRYRTSRSALVRLSGLSWRKSTAEPVLRGSGAAEQITPRGQSSVVAPVGSGRDPTRRGQLRGLVAAGAHLPAAGLEGGAP